jgi:hypothetical protein
MADFPRVKLPSGRPPGADGSSAPGATSPPASAPSCPATPYVFSPTTHAHLVPWLCALHASCVTHDGLLAGSFLPPLSQDRLLGWWKARIAEVAAGRRMILLLLEESAPGTRAKGEELRGTVMLALAPDEASPHCGAVEALLVRPEWRRRGGARTLVDAIEIEAVKKGRTLLVRPFLGV